MIDAMGIDDRSNRVDGLVACRLVAVDARLSDVGASDTFFAFIISINSVTQ